MDAARKALRSAIEDIIVRPGQILEGIYSSQEDGFFDVENVVIYNIETATFGNSGRNGLRARRSRSFSEASGQGYPHKLDYRLIPTPNVPSNPAAHIQFEPTHFRSVFDVWWAASNGRPIVTGSLSGRFGLYVEFSSHVLPSNPARKMKILFDGLIAAFQRDAEPDPEVVRRLAMKHGVDPDDLRARFLKPICLTIEPSRASALVRTYGANVQWNPADDLCEECTLVVTEKPITLCDAYIYVLSETTCG